MNLGDPRHQVPQDQSPVGVIVPPDSDKVVNVGVNTQFTTSPYPYLETHGQNLYVNEVQYAFPTFAYPDDVLIGYKQSPRPPALGFNGETIPARDWIDSKSMNGMTSAMAEAFCAYEGGVLQTIEVFDYITQTPKGTGIDVATCGVNHMNHGQLLSSTNSLDGTFVGGSSLIPDASVTNFSFDAGFALPFAGFVLNKQNYHFPDLGNSTAEKTWQIASPGRMVGDAITIAGNSEPFMDMCGNLTEQVAQTVNGQLNGRFAMRGFGIGVGSEFSDLNVLMVDGNGIMRLEHPEAKSGLTGFRCQFYK